MALINGIFALLAAKARNDFIYVCNLVAMIYNYNYNLPNTKYRHVWLL